MGKQKPEPEESGSSSSGDQEEEEEEEVQHHSFVRIHRDAQKSDSEEEEEDDDESDEDEGKVEAKSANPKNEESSDDDASSSDSEGTPADKFVVVPLGKKAAQKTTNKVSKSDVNSSKRARDGDVEETASSKKSKKGADTLKAHSKAKESGKSSKAKQDKSSVKEKKEKKSSKKSELHSEAEKPTDSMSPLLLPENGSVKKVSKAEKAMSDKSMTRIVESVSKKPPPSPAARSKLWLPKYEIVLSKEILQQMNEGVEIPDDKNDAFWSDLLHRLRGEFEGSWTKDQVCEKVNRMKLRYAALAVKVADSEKPHKFRTKNDRELYDVWSQIWGNRDQDNEESEDEEKEEQSKQTSPASPVKVAKHAHEKSVAVTPVKTVPADKHRQNENPNSESDDESESDEETDSEDKKESFQEDKKVTPMEADKIDCGDGAIVLKGKKAPLKSVSDAQQVFQGEIRASLSAIQECSKQMMTEWQNKAMTVVEGAMKAGLDRLRALNGVGGLGSVSCTSFKNLDMIDIQIPAGEPAFQQQWVELQLQELELCRQKLELMQKECNWKQDQLKSQLKLNKST